MSLYNTTLGQPFLFGAFLYSGILMGILWHLFRGLRGIFGKSRWLLLAGDVIFLAAAGGGVLYMVLSFTHFKLRLYYLVGIGLGFSLYSAAIRPLARGIKKKIHKKKIDNSSRG